jgi:hypothetical protein
MDAPAAAKPVRINRWLPYWAVLQADVHATTRSWVYRTWVFVSLASAAGYLLYRVGLDREAGIIQLASTWISDLLRWAVLGGFTLVVVLTAGAISSERGSMADSVLSRGISRYQYFLGKWHGRLVAVLGTFAGMGLLTIATGFFLLHEDVSLPGCLVALTTITAFLGAVVTAGVTVSAIANSTVLAIAVLWLVLYGSGLVLSLLPARLSFLDRTLHTLPNVLRGQYDLQAQLYVVAWCAIVSCLVALVGAVYFSRRDV